MDKMNFRSSGISYFSSSALMAVAEKYGEDVARGLFLSGVDIFSQSENEGAPLVSRMVRIEEIVGIDNFKELLHHDEFVNLIHSIARYDEDQQIRFGRSLYEQMVRAKQQYGEERFLQLCKNFGGLYFIRFSDVLVTTLSQDTLDLIFAAKRGAYPFFDIGFYLMQGKGGYETLRAFAALPIERQRLLVSEFAAGELMSQTIFAKWIENKTDRLVRVLFKSGFGTILHFGYGLVQRILSRIDLLIGIFSEDGVIELFQKRIVIKIIYESSEETVAKWSELLALPEEDRKYFLKNGLALEVLKNPSKAKLLKDDLGARLSVFFDCDPQIANQIDGLVGRLNQLGERGLNVDLVIRKMVKRITDPRVSDTDKIWYLFTRVFGEEWILKGSDPQLTNLTFRERFSRMRRRLEDIVTLNEDPNLIREADKRNREYAKDYVQSSVVKQPLLIHGKKDFYPQDLHLGYTAAEFLGMFQYKWEEKTANALNFMILEPGQELIDAYFSQKDPIVVNFGASRENALGVTHVFLPSDVEAAHGSCASKLYGGQHHGEQHMLILCGVPSTTELCALVSLKDKNHFNRVKRYYAKKPFYVPLIDVNSGVLVFTAEEYEAMRRQLIADGAVVDLKANTSVDAFVTKVLEYYSERDRAHGIKHIENTLQHVVAVCSELYEQSQDWFVSNGISYMEFVNLVKVAVVAHDIARDTKEDWEHAIAGAQIIADILDYGLSRRYLQLIQTAIKQHNLPKEERWGDDPITQALYDIDKADTSFERGADSKYVEMILPTVQSNYTRNILTELIDGKKV